MRKAIALFFALPCWAVSESFSQVPSAMCHRHYGKMAAMPSWLMESLFLILGRRPQFEAPGGHAAPAYGRPIEEIHANTLEGLLLRNRSRPGRESSIFRLIDTLLVQSAGIKGASCSCFGSLPGKMQQPHYMPGMDETRCANTPIFF